MAPEEDLSPLPFGWSPHPRYQSTWAAEFLSSGCQSGAPRQMDRVVGRYDLQGFESVCL